MLQLCLYEFFLEESVTNISTIFIWATAIPCNLHHWHVNPAPYLLYRKQIWMPMLLEHVLWYIHILSWLSLKCLVDALKLFLYFNKVNNAQRNNPITFVKGGAKLSKYIKMPHPGMLNLTADWKLLSDLGEKWVFHSFIGINCLRPNRHCSLLPLRL